MTSYNEALNRTANDLVSEIQKTRPKDLKEFLFSYAATRDLTLPPQQSGKPSSRVPPELCNKQLTIVVFGASGDLAKKKTYPALFSLYAKGLLPPSVDGDVQVWTIIGFARTKFKTLEEFHKQLTPYLEKSQPHHKDLVKDFLKRHVRYVAGRNYQDVSVMRPLIEMHEHREKIPENADEIAALAKKGPAKKKTGNRMFYLALPPTTFVSVCTAIKTGLVDVLGKKQTGGFTRVIIEKPFGHDTQSSLDLANALLPLFHEDQLYRIDHYLGKEMVQNMISLRFANHVFSSIWDYKHIASVQITFKETIGTEGRGGYFDTFGIIRDVMQNHLTQMLALVCMDKPVSLAGNDVRNEKVNLLKAVAPVTIEDCVIGQYTKSADGKIAGYLEDEGVPKDSKCPTFALLQLRINNDRWQGVPIYMKAGKALEEKGVTIRIQFRDEIYPYGAPNRNELVIKAQPGERIYMKVNTKTPGFQDQNAKELTTTELDLPYKHRYDVELPEAYESLINECLLGNNTNFVRSDELDAAWRIFTPLLHAIEKAKVPVHNYQAGTRGPAEADERLMRHYTETRNYRKSKL